ncbi:hypothetical protein [Fangia hongkongensis]|uniref:hypothetical protein n=1 Tax=Fangia hongkongensis TaxID=270495 RepID=UPI000381B0E0|nr:hypothetical protein [Fangia hongkongensis]MBK2124430.1 hypothetical protein [Fangia hongkongensis]
MRKQTCIKDVNYYINSIATGAERSRYKRKVVLYAMIDDLLHLGLLPQKLSQLKNDYIFKLVELWRNKGILSQTMQGRISILRKMMSDMYDIDIPRNKEFNFTSITFSKQSQLKVSKDVLELVHNPLSKSVLAFQIYFGLTKRESIKINLTTAIMSDDLMIHSDLATNKKTRFIPILTKTQLSVIDYRNDILGSYRTLTDRIPENMLVQLVNAEIYDCGYEINAPFRRIYAMERLAQLVKHKSQTIAKRMLIEELGYTSYDKLQKGLL